MDHRICSSWVHASLIKTGFNTRKTTAKGVRRMKKALRRNGFMPNNSVVIYPDPLQYTVEEDEHQVDDRCVITPSDRKEGKMFMCADGMHRVRSVVELTKEKSLSQGTSNIACGPFVFAIILRPDTPRKLLLQFSLSK